MAGRARLSVVIPTLDEAPVLGALLERLAARAGDPDRPDEVLVCDGDSRDDTLAIARAHGVRVLRAERGRGSQLRAGALATSGDVLLFLHADCRPAAGALSELRAALAAADCRWGSLWPRIEARGWFFAVASAAARARVRRLGLVYGDCGLFVRRELYAQVGGFAAQPLFEDLDLSRRLRAHAWPRVIAAPLLVSARRWQAEGPLRATARNWILQAAFLLGVSPQRLVRYYPQRAGGSTPRRLQP